MDKTLRSPLASLLQRAAPLLGLWVGSLALAAPLSAPLPSPVTESPASPLSQQVRQFVDGQVAPTADWRVELLVGELDARLRLAPCDQIQPYLPTGTRLWGKSRIGLRCVQGPTKWNVYLPVQVNVYGRALVAATQLPAGHVLAQADLKEAEVNLAEDNQPAIAIESLVVGRTLARPMTAGQSLRGSHLKARQWFAVGDSVSIHAVGTGFTAVSRGEALTPGLEGQAARVRTESGRVIQGMPVAQQQLEIAL